jgi:prolyl-tRNA editing enzyme YbaK/EbsC (Cys-tRNA(Pro) deacylase)
MMSKSLARVRAALEAAGLASLPVEMPAETRTAQQAAQAAGCVVDQIAKSIIFAGASGQLYLFLTAGGNQVDPEQASALAGEALGRAEIAQVREVTGFAIGGVAPVGHLQALPIWMDPKLHSFAKIWAAAGTPRHIFEIDPADLQRITAAKVANFTAKS